MIAGIRPLREGGVDCSGVGHGFRAEIEVMGGRKGDFVFV